MISLLLVFNPARKPDELMRIITCCPLRIISDHISIFKNTWTQIMKPAWALIGRHFYQEVDRNLKMLNEVLKRPGRQKRMKCSYWMNFEHLVIKSIANFSVSSYPLNVNALSGSYVMRTTHSPTCFPTTHCWDTTPSRTSCKKKIKQINITHLILRISSSTFFSRDSGVSKSQSTLRSVFINSWTSAWGRHQQIFWVISPTRITRPDPVFTW